MKVRTDIDNRLLCIPQPALHREEGAYMFNPFGMCARVLALAAAVLCSSGNPMAQDANRGSNQNTSQDSSGQVLRTQVNLVSVYFTVRDNKKKLASDLDQNKFRVQEDGKEQPIKFFAHHSDVVLNV